MVGLKGTHFSIELLLTSSGFDEVSPFLLPKYEAKELLFAKLFPQHHKQQREKKIFFLLFCLAFSVEFHLQSLSKKVNYRS